MLPACLAIGLSILLIQTARGLQPSGGHSLQGPTTHIQVAYGQDVYKTSTQYGTCRCVGVVGEHVITC